METTPAVSVIMSVYNGAAYLKEAIESVLNQSFTDWELIVINDCSTDGTDAILEVYAKRDSRIKVHRNETNLRLPSSLNRAAALAKGRLVARMDADDICLPNRLERQVDFMEKHPDAVLSACRYMTLCEGRVASGGGGGKTDAESIGALLLVTNPILHPGVMVRTAVLQQYLYNTALTCTEDLDLWTRLAAHHNNMEIQNEYLMLYRIHPAQITGTTIKRQYDEVMEIEKRYVPSLFEGMTEEERYFYIHGIYFKEAMDIKQFRALYGRVKQWNRTARFFQPQALDYAFFEILAEYKRCGLTKFGLLQGMLCFPPVFLIKELIARKKRATADGQACIAAARRIGLREQGQNVLFPQFCKDKR